MQYVKKKIRSQNEHAESGAGGKRGECILQFRIRNFCWQVRDSSFNWQVRLVTYERPSGIFRRPYLGLRPTRMRLFLCLAYRPQLAAALYCLLGSGGSVSALMRQKPEKTAFLGRPDGEWTEAQNIWAEYVRRPDEQRMPDFVPGASKEQDAAVRKLRAGMWTVYSKRAGPPREGCRTSGNALIRSGPPSTVPHNGTTSSPPLPVPFSSSALAGAIFNAAAGPSAPSHSTPALPAAPPATALDALDAIGGGAGAEMSRMQLDVAGADEHVAQQGAIGEQLRANQSASTEWSAQQCHRASDGAPAAAGSTMPPDAPSNGQGRPHPRSKVGFELIPNNTWALLSEVTCDRAFQYTATLFQIGFICLDEKQEGTVWEAQSGDSAEKIAARAAVKAEEDRAFELVLEKVTQAIISTEGEPWVVSFDVLGGDAELRAKHDALVADVRSREVWNDLEPAVLQSAMVRDGDVGALCKHASAMTNAGLCTVGAPHEWLESPLAGFCTEEEVPVVARIFGDYQRDILPTQRKRGVYERLEYSGGLDPSNEKSKNGYLVYDTGEGGVGFVSRSVEDWLRLLQAARASDDPNATLLVRANQKTKGAAAQRAACLSDNWESPAASTNLGVPDQSKPLAKSLAGTREGAVLSAIGERHAQLLRQCAGGQQQVEAASALIPAECVRTAFPGTTEAPCCLRLRLSREDPFNRHTLFHRLGQQQEASTSRRAGAWSDKLLPLAAIVPVQRETFLGETVATKPVGPARFSTPSHIDLFDAGTSDLPPQQAWSHLRTWHASCRRAPDPTSPCDGEVVCTLQRGERGFKSVFESFEAARQKAGPVDIVSHAPRATNRDGVIRGTCHTIASASFSHGALAPASPTLEDYAMNGRVDKATATLASLFPQCMFASCLGRLFLELTGFMKVSVNGRSQLPSSKGHLLRVLSGLTHAQVTNALLWSMEHMPKNDAASTGYSAHVKRLVAARCSNGTKRAAPPRDAPAGGLRRSKRHNGRP